MRPFFLLPHSKLPKPLYGTTIPELEASICRPPCERADCQNGYYTAEEQRHPALSYRYRLSNEDVKDIVQSYVKKTNEARERLARQLRSHADLLMSRWEKAKPRETRGTAEGCGAGC